MKLPQHLAAPTLLSVAIFLTSTVSTAHAALVYSQDFNTFTPGATDLGDGSTITSTTSVASVITDQGYTALRLTADGVGGTDSEWTLPDLNPGGEVTSFTASFDLLLYTAGGTTAADAFWFQFGDGSNDYQNSRLGIGFITYTTNQIQVWSSGTQIGGSYGTPAVYIYTFSDKFKSTTISWNETDGLSLSYGGTSLATNLSIPGFDPVSGDVFSFRAWTGAASQIVYLDNVSISTAAVPEPGTAITMILLGVVGFVGHRRRRQEC